MCKILLGANVVAMQGKLGGHVFQGIGGGQTIIRRKVSPNRHSHRNIIGQLAPELDRAKLQKQVMQFFAREWATLTQAQRQTWLEANDRGVRGFQLYMSRNAAFNVGSTTFTTYPGPMPAEPIVEFAVFLGRSTPGDAYTMSMKVLGSSPEMVVEIYVSSAVTNGRRGTVNGWRVISFQTISSGLSGFNVNVSSIGLPTNFFYNFAYRIALTQTTPFRGDPIPMRKV